MPQPAHFSYWIIFGPIAAVGTFSLLLLGLGRTGPRPPDAAWSGSFYSNPNDPALLVPKRFGMGYTLNFGNPGSWAVLTFSATHGRGAVYFVSGNVAPLTYCVEIVCGLHFRFRSV